MTDNDNGLNSLETRSQYGMPKIIMKDFDPERYILRIGFPDFPLCPYGNNFEALGYDLLEKRYVRFASSIMKRKDLVREKYTT